MVSGLVNKNYYERIETVLAGIENPTIAHAIKVMQQQGNREFIESLPYLKQNLIQEQFEEVFPEYHEVTHLTAKIPHTPFGEELVFPLELALEKTPYHRVKYKMDDLFHQYTQTDHKRYEDVNDATRRTINDRDKSIYYAAGLYLRQKIENYFAMGMQDLSYGEQLNFSREYSDFLNDSPPMNEDVEIPYDKFLDAPYELITLSRGEWRAITAVATGMKRPQDTGYPERMEPIKEALVESKLFHDLRQKWRKNFETEYLGR